MARRHPAAWRPRDETYHPHIHAAMEHPYETDVHWNGVETYERAREIKRGLHLAGRHLRQSVRVDLADAKDGTITVTYRLFDKAKARAYIKDQGRWNGH